MVWKLDKFTAVGDARDDHKNNHDCCLCFVEYLTLLEIWLGDFPVDASLKYVLLETSIATTGFRNSQWHLRKRCGSLSIQPVFMKLHDGSTCRVPERDFHAR